MKEQTEFQLDRILEDSWERLSEGAQSPQHPFHFPVISTFNKDFPESRVVVLREVLQKENALVFYSDVRSPKIQQIKENPHISWLFYDAISRIQLRIRANASLHFKDEISLAAWENSRLESRRAYLSQPAPSTVVVKPTDGLPKDLKIGNLSKENVKDGYQNFIVVKTKVLEMDWLWLSHNGHLRASFKREAEEYKMEWMLP